MTEQEKRNQYPMNNNSYKKYFLKFLPSIISFLCIILLEIVETQAEKKGLELRTPLQDVKFFVCFLVAPLVIGLQIYFAIRYTKDYKEQRKFRVLINVAAALICVLFIVGELFASFMHLLDPARKEERVLEDGILELTTEGYNSDTVEYYEQVGFFFRKPFEGYDEETLIQKVQERYPAVEYVGKEHNPDLSAIESKNDKESYIFSDVIPEVSSLISLGRSFSFPETSFSFHVENNYLLEDDYPAQRIRALADLYYETANRYLTWGEEYGQLLVSFNGRADLENFSEYVTGFYQLLLQDPYFGENSEEVEQIHVYADYGTEGLLNITPTTAEIFSDGGKNNEVEIYNTIYLKLDEWLNELAEDAGESGFDEATLNADELDGDYETPLDADEENPYASQNNFWVAPFTEEQKEYISYLQSLEDDSSCTLENGTVFHMVATDRAAGSSYYCLYAEENGEVLWMQQEPFNGGGGVRTWVTFFDEGLGFIGRTYSGGSIGAAYRTEDGGQTFTEINLPSPHIQLSDGSYYNPFVDPEEIYRQGDVLFLIAGQGADGDYYSDNVRVRGCYRSEDKGETWTWDSETE